MNKVIHKKSTSTINAKGVMKRHFKSALALFMPLFVVSCLTISSALILSSSGSTAIETEAITTTVKVLEACSMTANPDSTDTAHSVEMIGGTVENSIGVTTIDVTCNDRDGYSVYAVGYGNNTVGNTDLTGAVTGQTIPTGTNMTTSVSNWAMRLTAVDNSTNYFVPTILSDTNGSFAANHAVPSNNTKVVTFQNAIDVSKPSRFTTTYAAAVTPYQAADTYTGQVKYTLVHPNYANADGTINNFNVTVALTNVTSIEIDGTEYTNGEIASLAQGSTHTIAANYDSANYTFSSWSVSPAASGTIADSTSDETTYTVVADGATLTATASANCMSTVSGTMQNFDPTKLCSTAGTSGTLTDSRGGTTKSYTVAKLADGKWWMTTNLDLPGGTTVTTADSDVTEDFILPASSIYGFSDETKADGYVYNSGNTTNCGASGQNTPCYSYYSYSAATAGTGASINGDGVNATSSICPKGWRLPTATTSNAQANTNNNWKTGDFYALATAYGANLESNFYENSGTFYTNAGPGTTPGFLLAGRYDVSTFRGGGSYGAYWSSTSTSGVNAYTLSFNSLSVNSADSSYRRSGFPVRCVYVPTMQDATASSLAALMPNTSDTTTLVDSRDGKKYSVAKLADGKYWMTSNLDLPGGTVLNASDSDVPRDGYFTVPTSTKTGFSNDSTAYAFNSNSTDCSSDDGCYSYYSWLTATAGGKDASGTAVTGDGYNAAYSICPKGWRLPTATTSNAQANTNNNWKTGDFYALATAYGANLESNYYDNSGATGANFYNNAGLGTTPGFLLAGNYLNSTFYNGSSRGYYWSSTSLSGTYAYNLHFTSSRVDSAYYSDRRDGFSVRCLAES